MHNNPGPTPVPSTVPTSAPTQSPASAQVIHVGFDLAENTDPKFGPVYFYSTMLNNMAQVIRVMNRSLVVFVNDDPNGTPQTASGFGTSAFRTRSTTAAASRSTGRRSTLRRRGRPAR